MLIYLFYSVLISLLPRPFLSPSPLLLCLFACFLTHSFRCNCNCTWRCQSDCEWRGGFDQSLLGSSPAGPGGLPAKSPSPSNYSIVDMLAINLWFMYVFVCLHVSSTRSVLFLSTLFQSPSPSFPVFSPPLSFFLSLTDVHPDLKVKEQEHTYYVGLIMVSICLAIAVVVLAGVAAHLTRHQGEVNERTSFSNLL